MKTIEELEAELETVTRERDLALFAWEAAGMTGRTAQSAMLELARQLEEARAEIAALTDALDERDLEAERGLEQYDRLVCECDDARAEAAKWKAGFEEFRSRNTDLMMHLFEAQEKVRAVNIEPMLHLNSQLRSKVHGLSSEVERLTNELQRERIGIRPVDEVRSDAFRRGAEAMRDECIGAACEFFMGTTGFCNGDEDELEAVLEALPIPEEP